MTAGVIADVADFRDHRVQNLVLHTQGIGLTLGIVEVIANEGLGEIAGAAARWEEFVGLRLNCSEGRTAGGDALEGATGAGEAARADERSLVSDVQVDVVEGGFDVDCIAAANDQLPIEVGVPGEAEAGLN